MEVITFALGVLFFYTHYVYIWLYFIIAFIFKTTKSIIIWFVIAYLWALIHQIISSDHQMPQRAIISAVITGEIISIPNHSDTKTQFTFLIHKLNHHAATALVLLNCYKHCNTYNVGELWRLQVTLKKPHNLANPGNFDYVGNLKIRHIFWVGSITAAITKLPQTNFLKKIYNLSFIQLWRQRISYKIAQFVKHKQYLGIVQALTFGITDNIDKEQWELFRRTGTTHLIVISGSHIALIAGFTFFIIEMICRQCPRLCLYYPSRQIASVVACLFAIIYTLLVGMAVPAQRSLIAYVIFLSSNIIRRCFNSWQSWRYAVFLVLLYEPHAILLPGFYLSFITVAILLSINKKNQDHGIIGILLLQLYCMIGLLPLTLYWFSYGAITGFLANIIAIPLVEYIIVPFALINVLLIQIYPVQILLEYLQKIIQFLLYYLHLIDAISIINLQYSFLSISSVCILMLVLFLIIFFSVRSIWLALMIIIISIIFIQKDTKQIALGAAKIDILDVGQGLSILIRTTQHNLLYDTGMKFYRGSDMGKLVILPYIKTLNINRLHKVIISHPDLDHRGGLASIREQLFIDELIDNRTCHHYHSWQWDGVKFNFLAIKNNKFYDNNKSCVLKISTKNSSILLPGDIEIAAEKYLLQHYSVRADVLLIPHHGSKTSSSANFIQQVRPKIAVISAGLYNRYHFPHQQTLKTLQHYHVKILQTSQCGMISLNFSKKINISCFNGAIQ